MFARVRTKGGLFYFIPEYTTSAVSQYFAGKNKTQAVEKKNTDFYFFFSIRV